MSIAEDLVKLHQLHRDGGLTEAEFAVAKARVLAECPANPNPKRSQRDGGLPEGSRAFEAPSTKWPASARALAMALLIVIAVIAAPIAYRAFENWVLSHAEWTFVWE